MNKIIDITDFEKRKLTVLEVAHIFKIHKSTVWRLVRKDTFPKPKKFGCATRWDGAEIAEYMKTGVAA